MKNDSISHAMFKLVFQFLAQFNLLFFRVSSSKKLRLDTTHVYKCSLLEEYFLLISLCKKKEKAQRP
jgi:hypothetical protein